MKFALIACLFLIACGGGDAPAPSYTTSALCSTQPGDFYCITMAYLKPGQHVSVTVDGSIAGAGTRSLAVIVDDVPAGQVLASAGQFQLRHGFSVTAEGWHKVGFTTAVVSGSPQVADGARISVEAQ